jgi:hypothetical protein
VASAAASGWVVEAGQSAAAGRASPAARVGAAATGLPAPALLGRLAEETAAPTPAQRRYAHVDMSQHQLHRTVSDTNS